MPVLFLFGHKYVCVLVHSGDLNAIIKIIFNVYNNFEKKLSGLIRLQELCNILSNGIRCPYVRVMDVSQIFAN